MGRDGRKHLRGWCEESICYPYINPFIHKYSVCWGDFRQRDPETFVCCCFVGAFFKTSSFFFFFSIREALNIDSDALVISCT